MFQIQYKFIYDCLLEAAVCGVTEISAQEFRQRFNNLSNKDQKTGKDGFHREFTVSSYYLLQEIFVIHTLRPELNSMIVLAMPQPVKSNRD